MPWTAACSLALLLVLGGLVGIRRHRRRAKTRANRARVQLPARIIDEPVSMVLGAARRRLPRVVTVPQFSGSVLAALRPKQHRDALVELLPRGTRRPRIYFQPR